MPYILKEKDRRRYFMLYDERTDCYEVTTVERLAQSFALRKLASEYKKRMALKKFCIVFTDKEVLI